MLTVAESLNVDVDMFSSRMAGDLVVRMTSEVLAERLLSETQEATFHMAFPSSPWQHFKRDHAETWWLGWIVRRRPVKNEIQTHTRSVTFTRYAKFPHASISLPELGSPVIFEQASGLNWWE